MTSEEKNSSYQLDKENEENKNAKGTKWIIKRINSNNSFFDCAVTEILFRAKLRLQDFYLTVEFCKYVSVVVVGLSFFLVSFELMNGDDVTGWKHIVILLKHTHEKLMTKCWYLQLSLPILTLHCSIFIFVFALLFFRLDFVSNGKQDLIQFCV